MQRLATTCVLGSPACSSCGVGPYPHCLLPIDRNLSGYVIDIQMRACDHHTTRTDCYPLNYEGTDVANLTLNTAHPTETVKLEYSASRSVTHGVSS